VFSANVYKQRRKRLKKDIKSGILLFLGNEESPINYPDNCYVFRQDSSFLYFWGLDLPGLAAIIDIDAERDTLFGRDLTLEEKIWSGPQTALKEHGFKSGVHDVAAFDRLEAELLQAKKKGRNIHFLPQYRPQNLIRIQELMGIDATLANASASGAFIRAVVAQRSIKTQEEIEQIEAALDITYEMQILAMKMSQPGIYEKEVAGAMAGLSYSRGGAGLAFPIIFTVKGHIQHNPHHGNLMRAGDMIVSDCGAESAMHYASDITRTFPVNGKFNQQQREIYSIVYEAQKKAIEDIRSGVEYRDVHFLACRDLCEGLKALGLIKGDVDAAVAAGAHALFMPGGLGHMLGLDVHDMEGLGEDCVGYTDQIQRSVQFGTCNLRLARALESGFVITVEPGLYFIPELIDQCIAEKKFEEFIDYSKVEAYRNFGGIRIEDDVLVMEDSRRVLGKPIPKSIEDVEAFSSQFL
jgi:Xaa-Pro aminopeptidase